MNFKRKGLVATLALAILLMTGALLLSSFQARRATDDIWNLLGLSRQNGTEDIKNSFLEGYLHSYGAKNAKLIAMNDRASIAKDLLEYTKEYISSPEFKKQYDDLRKRSRPTEPIQLPVRTVADIQKEEIARTEKGIRDTEKIIKEQPDLAKTFQPILDMHKQNLKEYQKAANPLFAMIETGEKDQRAYNEKRYKDDMETWATKYPDDIRLFISARLQRMLDLTNGIDYTAALVEKNGKKKFVNTAYESKKTEWKQGFRAGREVTETSRAFAQKWLAELK